MSGVKEVNANSTPIPTSAPTSGSAPLSASEAAAAGRAARKSVELQAGQAVIADAARRAAQAKEELEKERMEKENEYEAENEPEKRDTSELSRQSKWFGIDGRLLEAGDIKWVLEMEQELLEALLRWMPSGDSDIAKQLEELSRLYLALLEAVLTHTVGDEQAAQLARLDEILAQKLALLLDTDLKDLVDFLKDTGQTETLQNVKSSVYKQTTGTSISAKAADQFYARGKTGNPGNTRYFMPESTYGRQAGRIRAGQAARSGAEQAFRGGAGQAGGTRQVGAARESAVSTPSYASAKALSDEGSIYKLTEGRNIRLNQQFDASRKSGEIQMSQRNRALSGGGGKGWESTGIAGGRASFTGNDLARANRFAAHINGSGNLLNHPGITAKNEEVVGYLAAVTTIKGEMFAASSGRKSAMNIPVKSAVNQLVDYYLTRKGIYKVYDYTTNVYEKTGNPQKALEEGLEYAYRLFQEKKDNPEAQKQAAYLEQAGFFQMLLKNQNMQSDLLRGMRLLEENWREFLKSIGENEKHGISLKMQKHSPWGILLEPGEQRSFFGGKSTKIILTEAAVVAVLLAVYLCYRLLAG